MDNVIRKHRRKAGMTLQELADSVGSSKAYMWQMENKDSPDPGVSLAQRMAAAMGVSVDTLFPSNADRAVKHEGEK